MSPLDEIDDARIRILEQHLHEYRPTAVWYARGFRGGWRTVLDPRTHRTIGPPDLVEAVKTAVFDTPGLDRLNSYSPNSAQIKAPHLRIQMASSKDVFYAEVVADREVSVVVMLGIPAHLIRRYNPDAHEEAS